MKKLIFTLLISIISINFVYADGDYYMSTAYDGFPYYSTTSSTVIDTLVDYYNNNYANTYNYYYITYAGNTSTLTQSKLMLVATNEPYYYAYKASDMSTWEFGYNNVSAANPRYCYDYNNDTYSTSCGGGGTLPYKTSSSFTFVTKSTTPRCSPQLHNYCADTMTIPSYSNLELDISIPLINIVAGNDLPTYETTVIDSPTSDFITVNLSSYDYIVLSLKDYTQEPFNTTIYTQGSLCFTPVYNYGMQQKQDTIPGYQTAGCTEVYSSNTPVNVYIIQSDLTNHAVYYIKQQQNVPTTLKIPTSIFDITYINSNNTDPQVVIGGRSYPVIPFSDLTDTANKSSNEGYVSGRVCSLGDVNCQAENMGMDISDLFTSPLTLLQTVWSSITSIFAIIATFIGVLPPTLQVFLYTSFMLALIIGIIKIIL